MKKYLHILKNSRVLVSKIVIVFLKFQQKIRKYEIFFENSKVFFLSETLSELIFIQSNLIINP